MSTNYKILPEIDKLELPPKRKWIRIFNPLPFDKAIPLECETRKIAQLLGSNIQSSLRYGRRPYKIRTRLVPNGNKYLLYVWKEQSSAV